MAAQAPDFKAGQLLPGTKYRVVKQLGAGGMGVVYQVVKPPEIMGVLKLMSTELTDHQEFRTRFFDEVRVLAQLDHPNIVRVFDYDSLTDGTPYYVMEMLHGRTVRDVLATMGTMPPRVAFEVTRQLCEALHCAHTHDIPVIHRDIKPENIFLHAPRHGEPVVKLIDFGVVAVADRQHDGTFVGTWKYAAPEQIRGMRATPETDLYAVGLVLYEMLCGIGPFEDKESGTLVSQAHLHEIPAPVSKFAPWVPPSIVALIASALAKDPKQRPKDAYAFAERLFELEWANDGKDPHDLTSEGPSGASRPGAGAAGAQAGAAAGAARARVPGEGQGPGPLSRVLSTAQLDKPSSKNLVAAAPAADRLGDVPLIGIPQEARHDGPTLKGMGGNTQEPTSPGEDALLAGLGARPEFRSKKAKESGPSLPEEGSGGDGKVVIRPRSGDVVSIDGTPLMPSVVPSARAGAGFVAGARTDPDSRDATTGKIPARVTPDPMARPDRKQSDTDTFASQESDARRATPSKMGRLAVPIALAAVVVLGVGGFFALRGRGAAARGDGHAEPDPRSALGGSAPATAATAATAAVPNPTAPVATVASATAISGPIAPVASTKGAKTKGSPQSLASQRSAGPSAPATTSPTPAPVSAPPPTAAATATGNPAPAKSAKHDDSFIRGL